MSHTLKYTLNTITIRPPPFRAVSHAVSNLYADSDLVLTAAAVTSHHILPVDTATTRSKRLTLWNVLESLATFPGIVRRLEIGTVR